MLILVLRCCCGICHEVLSFIQIGYGHTVMQVLFYKCSTLKMLLKPKIQITQLLANTQDSARISMGAQPPTPPIEIDKFFRRQSVLPLARAQRQRFDRISRPSDRQSSFNLQRVKTYKIFLSLKNYLSKKFIKNKHVKSTK